MRWFLGVFFMILVSCQEAKLEFIGNSTALTRVRLNAVISDNLPFKGERLEDLKTSDLVFFSGYINRLVQQYNQELARLNIEFDFVPVTLIKNQPVYRQFPQKNNQSSLVLLPYYQTVPYESKAVRALVLQDLNVDSLIMFDFSFYTNADNLALRVDLFLVTVDGIVTESLTFETPVSVELSFLQTFSFEGPLQPSILMLLRQFETFFLAELTSIKNK